MNTSVPHRPRRRPLITAIIALSILGAGGIVASTASLIGGGAAASPPSPEQPDAADGWLRDVRPVTVRDDALPAIGNLDDALAAAMLAATDAAAEDGIELQITSGWRSQEYQQWLMNEAIAEHGDEHTARQYVAEADTSRHLTGEAVDIGPTDAQYWLISYGNAYGLCQIYANETWHFELATTPGGTCPALYENAAAR